MEPAPESVEDVIARAKRELQRMIDTNPDIMLLVDSSGTVLRTNRALLDAIGTKDYADAVGQRADRLLACAEADLLPRLRGAETGPRTFEVDAGMRDGAGHALRLTMIGAGADTWVLMVRDVTGEKSAAAKLEKSHKREAVQALAGALMHHANQALTVIMVTASLLQMELEKGVVDQEKLKAAMRSIVDNATRVSVLIQRAESQTDYVTEPYLEGLDILNLEP